MRTRKKLALQQMRARLRVEPILYFVLFVAVACLVPNENPHISVRGGMVISVVAGLALWWMIHNSMLRYSPLNEGLAIRMGCQTGMIEGLALGLMVGWGGSPPQVGFWLPLIGFSAGCSVLGILYNLVLFRSARRHME